MSNLIPADKLISEIERLAKSYQDPIFITVRGNTANNFRDNLLSFITSLQQEQPEVDFEKELDRIWFDNKLGNYFDNDALDYAHIKTLCKHFYELGLNARKEE